MNIYHFDPITRIYLGYYTEALPDPVEDGRWLVPAFSTTKEPPAVAAGQIAVYVHHADGSQWEVRDIPRPEEAAPIVVTDQDKINALKSEARRYVNATAREYGFDDIAEAVSYVDEPSVPKYQKLGRALRAWRSLFWDAFETQIEQCKESGDIPESLLMMTPNLPAFRPE